MDGIVGTWTENVWLASKGGGIGTYWGNLRSIGEKIGKVGKTSGVIPFMKVMDSQTLAISQGSLRRGSAAVYLQISHPEIEEFIEIRKPVGGDTNRKCLNLHHGILIPDAFMRAVENDEEWALTSPKDGSIIRKISARNLWIRILTARVETGEPYLIFIDHVNRAIPEHHKLAGLTVKTSNLCSEITLPTGVDRFGKNRTAVCCLSSLNVETFLEWQDHPTFVEDVMRFLDNVLQGFIEACGPGHANAAYGAMRERSVGLGVMGFHSFLQSQSVALESVMSKVWNTKIFSQIKRQADAASHKLAAERGACPDAADYGINERFSNKIAIAPTASISIICGGSSPGIEPMVTNSYTHKTLSGSFPVRNKWLEKVLEAHGKNDDETWSSITLNGGGVQHLPFLTDQQKLVFKTAIEIDQRWIIELAADRTPYICQSQSLNIFLPADIHKKDLHQIHFMAWQRGVKTMYYCRSQSLQRAESSFNSDIVKDSGQRVVDEKQKEPYLPLQELGGAKEENKYDECLACQ
jgi:ribonucleoside-diphosphate reductase alpha chain